MYNSLTNCFYCGCEDDLTIEYIDYGDERIKVALCKHHYAKLLKQRERTRQSFAWQFGD